MSCILEKVCMHAGPQYKASHSLSSGSWLRRYVSGLQKEKHFSKKNNQWLEEVSKSRQREDSKSANWLLIISTNWLKKLSDFKMKVKFKARQNWRQESKS